MCFGVLQSKVVSCEYLWGTFRRTYSEYTTLLVKKVPLVEKTSVTDVTTMLTLLLPGFPLFLTFCYFHLHKHKGHTEHDGCWWCLLLSNIEEKSPLSCYGGEYSSVGCFHPHSRLTVNKVLRCQIVIL